MRTPLKLLVTVGTEFFEDEAPSRVTRVTDLMFDTLNTVDGTVKVRSLRAWETLNFLNRISGVTGLLRGIRENIPNIGKSVTAEQISEVAVA
jgi:hypothetical protein